VRWENKRTVQCLFSANTSAKNYESLTVLAHVTAYNVKSVIWYAV